MLAVHEVTLSGRCGVGSVNEIEMSAEPGGDFAKLVQEVLFSALTMVMVCHDELITGVCRVGVWLSVHDHYRVLISMMPLVIVEIAKVMAWMVMPVVICTVVDLIAAGSGHLASHGDFGLLLLSG